MSKCPQCNDKGEYRVAETNPSYNWMVWNSPPHFERRVCCTCPIGKSLKELDDRMNEPGYVNPFSVMTDDEILYWISK